MFKRNDLKKHNQATSKHVTTASVAKVEVEKSLQTAKVIAEFVENAAGIVENSEIKTIPTRVHIQTNQQKGKTAVRKNTQVAPKIKNNAPKEQVRSITKPGKTSNAKHSVISKVPVQVVSGSSNQSKRKSTLPVNKNSISKENPKSVLSFGVSPKVKGEHKVAKTSKKGGNWKNPESQSNLIKRSNHFVNDHSKNTNFHKNCFSEETCQLKRSNFRRFTQSDIKLNSLDTSDGDDRKNIGHVLTSPSVKNANFTDLRNDNLNASSGIDGVDRNKRCVSNKLEDELSIIEEKDETQKESVITLELNATGNGNIVKKSKAYHRAPELNIPSSSIGQHLESSKTKNDLEYFEFIENTTSESSPSKQVFSAKKDFDDALATPTESKEHKTFADCTTMFENTSSSSKGTSSIPRLSKAYSPYNFEKDYKGNFAKCINKEIAEKFHEKAMAGNTENFKVVVPEVSMEECSEYIRMFECTPEDLKNVSSTPKVNATFSPIMQEKLSLSMGEMCNTKEYIDKNYPEAFNLTAKAISNNATDSEFPSTVPSKILVKDKRQSSGIRNLKNTPNRSAKVCAIPKLNRSLSPVKQMEEVFENDSLKSINRTFSEALPDVNNISEETVDFNVNSSVPMVPTDYYKSFSKCAKLFEYASIAAKRVSPVLTLNINNEGKKNEQILENNSSKSSIVDPLETSEVSNVTSKNKSYSKSAYDVPVISTLNSKECIKHSPTKFHSKIKSPQFKLLPKKSVEQDINDKIKFLTSKFLKEMKEDGRIGSHRTGKKKGVLSKYYDDQMSKAVTCDTNVTKNKYKDTTSPYGPNLRNILKDDREESKKVFQDAFIEDTTQSSGQNIRKVLLDDMEELKKVFQSSLTEDTTDPYGQSLREVLNDDREELKKVFQTEVSEDIKHPYGQYLQDVLSDDREELRKVFQTAVTGDSKQLNSLKENDMKYPVSVFNSIDKRRKHEDTPYPNGQDIIRSKYEDTPHPFGQNFNISNNDPNDDVEDLNMIFQTRVSKQTKGEDSPSNKNNIRSPVSKFQSMEATPTTSRIPRFINTPVRSNFASSPAAKLAQCSNGSEKQNQQEKFGKMAFYYETPKRPKLITNSLESIHGDSNRMVEKELTYDVRYHEKNGEKYQECLNMDSVNDYHYSPKVNNSTSQGNKSMDENDLALESRDPSWSEYEPLQKSKSSEQMDEQIALDEKKAMKNCSSLSKGYTYRPEIDDCQAYPNQKKKLNLNRKATGKAAVRRDGKDIAIYRKLAVSIFLFLMFCGLLIAFCRYA